MEPPTWDELTRFALDEPIEGKRASEVVAALLVMQRRHLALEATLQGTKYYKEDSLN
ncbi:MAG TPA: hypothetical protein VKB87_08765 [Myxococcaceae bacterium]|nr:hypothetical protein [Myxococcaceae bacterium]